MLFKDELIISLQQSEVRPAPCWEGTPSKGPRLRRLAGVATRNTPTPSLCWRKDGLVVTSRTRKMRQIVRSWRSSEWMLLIFPR